MKTTVLLFSLFSFLLITNKTFSQGEAAVPFLLLQPSPSLAAMGQTGTALPTEDPFGFLWNPAQLGYTSQNNNFSFIFYPSKLDWLPTFNLDLEVKGLAFNLGYNLKDLIDFPLSVGFGYAKTEIDYGHFFMADEYGNVIGTFEAKDYYHAYSAGIGIDYFVQFNAGITYKDITSKLIDLPTGFDLLGDDFQMKVINFSLTVEADDILITRDSTGWDYQSTLSDLQFVKNLINIEGTDKIVSHIGLKLDLFETISLSTGHFSGRGFTDNVPETSGFELRTKGIFKLWALLAENPISDFLSDHIDLRYYNTNYFDGNWQETKMTGLALYVHNLNSLF